MKSNCTFGPNNLTNGGPVKDQQALLSPFIGAFEPFPETRHVWVLCGEIMFHCVTVSGPRVLLVCPFAGLTCWWLIAARGFKRAVPACGGMSLNWLSPRRITNTRKLKINRILKGNSKLWKALLLNIIEYLSGGDCLILNIFEM